MDAQSRGESVLFTWSEASFAELDAITKTQSAIDSGAPQLINESTLPEAQQSRMFALRDGHTLKGLVSFRQLSHKLIVENLWIDSSVRGNPGIWRKLLRLCSRTATEAAATTLYARTTFSNTNAQEIYQRLSSGRTVDMRLGHIEYTIPVENLQRYL